MSKILSMHCPSGGAVVLPPAANVCVAAPSSQIGSKKPSTLEVGPLNFSFRGFGERCKLPHRGLGRSPSEKRIWCILALVIRRSGQTRKVANNCQTVSGVTVGPSYCAGISSVSYCSLLTKQPNPFCSANANLKEAEFPNSPPNAAPAQCRQGCMPPSPPPPSRCNCTVLTSSVTLILSLPGFWRYVLPSLPYHHQHRQTVSHLR